MEETDPEEGSGDPGEADGRDHEGRGVGERRAANLFFRTVVDSKMFHVLGASDRDQFVAELDEVAPSGGHYCVLEGAQRAEGEIYGFTTEEIRRQFSTDGWEALFAIRTAFERRQSSNSTYFVGGR